MSDVAYFTKENEHRPSENRQMLKSLRCTEHEILLSEMPSFLHSRG